MSSANHIASVRAWEILDSRGNPTVRAEVVTEGGSSGVASVPSGASTGVHEALELRDGDAKRYGGKGVLKAVHSVNGPIAKALVGKDVTRQEQIDRMMLQLDGTPNKSKLGANAILAVSLACARAGAHATGSQLYRYIRKTYRLTVRDFRLPVPMMNILNGGQHANSGLSIQEFMVIPQRARFAERLRIGTEVFHALKAILGKRDFPTTVGDEGGFAPRLGDNERALKVILEAIVKAGYKPGKDVALGLDVAASEFYDEKTQRYAFKDPETWWTPKQMHALFEKWIAKYPLVSIEDPFAEDDWDNWKELTARVGKSTQIVGDDLFVTNVKRLQMGIRKKVGNAILVKVNQIGSLTETMRAIALARKAKYRVIISHRSGETADTFIADLAVATNAEYIKTGSLSRSERVEKYNRLLAIEQELAKH
ncbi:MAG: phosphopyruvate hydratase [bacterium]|nr:phosphopyruvate hydratase [bacterium]